MPRHSLPLASAVGSAGCSEQEHAGSAVIWMQTQTGRLMLVYSQDAEVNRLLGDSCSQELKSLTDHQGLKCSRPESLTTAFT